MCKAEEKSQNRYPTLAEELAFIDGYEQAEKDLELSWKNIEKICLIAKDVHKFYGFWTQRVYEEVLKRYNEERSKK